MKVLETRHTSADVILITWSPKMDLVAIVNSKPEMILHRLTWQKVWTLGNNLGRRRDIREIETLPFSLTFHPEGLYLAVGFEDALILVEVETGNILTTHEVDHLSAVQWKSTIYEYDHSVNDMTVSSPEAGRLESNTSILLLGTKFGRVHIYTGAGLLFIVSLNLISSYPCHVLKMEIPSDFSSVQVLASNQVGGDEENNVLSLYHFDCSEYSFHGNILGVFAMKALSYKRYATTIDTELSGLHENWGKIVEIYKHYLTYGTGKMSETIVADYVDLLMTGISSIEMEMFLGSGGREKEAKKFITTLQAAAASFNENLSNIMENILSFLRELVEISGYHSYLHISKYQDAGDGNGEMLSEGMKVVGLIRKLLSLLYHGVLHAQDTANNFLRSFLHFITLVINTIQTYHVIEAPEVLDEEANPERVFELLKFKVTRNIFEMLELNPEDPEVISKMEKMYAGDPPVEDKILFLDEMIPRMTASELKKFYEAPDIIDITKLSGVEAATSKDSSGDREWPSLWKFLKEKGIQLKLNLLHHPNAQLNSMLLQFQELLEEQIQALLQIPLLESEVPKCNFFLNCFENHNLEIDHFGHFYNSNTFKTFIYHKEVIVNQSNSEGENRVWLYQVEHLDQPDPILTVALLSFSRHVQSADFLNDKFLSVLCYVPHASLSQSEARSRPTHLDTEEDYEPLEIPGQAILCHMDMTEILDKLPSRNLRIPQTTTFLSNKWTQVNVSVPTDVTVPGPIEHDCITQILPIASFHPILMALSGARRVGALVDVTKRGIQLLEMDMDPPENSIDLDTTTGSTASTISEDVKDMVID